MPVKSVGDNIGRPGKAWTVLEDEPGAGHGMEGLGELGKGFCEGNFGKIA